MTAKISRKRAIVANYWKTFLEKRVSDSNDDDSTLSEEDGKETENDEFLTTTIRIKILIDILDL